MRFYNLLFCPVVAVLLLWGCRNKTEVVQFAGLEEPEKQKSYSTEIFNDDYLFSYPQQLIRYDSLLVVSDYFDRTEAFHLFSTHDGHFLYSFGRKGRGPGEVISPGSISLDRRNGMVVWDGGQKKLLRYRMPLNAGDSVRYAGQLQNLRGAHFGDIFFAGEDCYVFGHVDPLRFGRLAGDSVGVLYSDYPLLTEDEEANRSVWNYEPHVCATADGRHFAVSCYLGAALEIFSIDRDSIRSEKLLAIAPPIYRVVEGTRPKWVAAVDETIDGFLDLQASDRYIYALLCDSQAPYGARSIRVFDWEGNPVFRMNFDRVVQQICVDEPDGIIYGTYEDAETGEYHLLKLRFDPNDWE